MDRILEMLKIDSAYSVFVQLIGFVGLALAVVAYQMKTQKKIVTIQVVGCSFFSLHFLLLGAYTGALLNLIAAVRAFVFANKDKKWAGSMWWVAFFSVISVVAVSITGEGWYSVLPMLGMVFTTVSSRVSKASLVRLISLPSSPLWIIYNAINRSYAGIITELFVMISIITAMIRLDIKRSEKAKNLKK